MPYHYCSLPVFTILTIIRADGGNDPNVRGDAFKTLFVARLSYDTKEKDLEREFGRFGPIERVRFLVFLMKQTQLI